MSDSNLCVIGTLFLINISITSVLYIFSCRYFIILDDLWDESVWNILSCAFPTNSHGSRVITTTRIETVGRACCAYQADFIYKMQCLNAKDSETLFFSRIFGSKDQCPENLEEGLVEIVRKCDGVPLAIVTVAQHLASRQTTFKGTIGVSAKFSVHHTRNMFHISRNTAYIKP